MSQPFLAEIIMCGFNFPPRGWALCDGQILPINQNQSLYSLLGTTYGGDGRVSFALPDMRGRIPIHNGSSQGPGLSPRKLGQKGGSQTNTLVLGNLPQHTHGASTTAAASIGAGTEEDDASPQTRLPGTSAEGNVYTNSASVNMGTTVMPAPPTVFNTGNSTPVNNIQPVQVINFIIALQGVFPSRN